MVLIELQKEGKEKEWCVCRLPETVDKGDVSSLEDRSGLRRGAELGRR